MMSNNYRWSGWLLCGLLAISLPVRAAVYHVAPGGDDANDGSNWGQALATISHAVAWAGAGDTVIVSNGTYMITAEIEVTDRITIRGTNGWENTIIDGGGAVRGFSLSHADAVLDELTISNGFVNISGQCDAGVHMTAGTIRNSLIVDCYGFATGNGLPQGGGIWMSGGTVENSRIQDNRTSNTSTRDYALIRGGGIYMTGGNIESCTIAGNESFHYGGGVYLTSGSMTNTIIYENSANTNSHNVYSTGGLIGYSCATELEGGVNGNKTADPDFVLSGTGFGLNLSYGDYRISKSSSLIDAGINQTWMVNALDLDGYYSRILAGIVDMGAYETLPPHGTMILVL